MPTLKISISGKVQGVFFRASTKKVSDHLNLKGFAKNESDGTVTVIAVGNKENLNKLLDWCKKGSDYSKVDNVKIEWIKSDAKFEQFDIY